MKRYLLTTTVLLLPLIMVLCFNCSSSASKHDNLDEGECLSWVKSVYDTSSSRTSKISLKIKVANHFSAPLVLFNRKKDSGYYKSNYHIVLDNFDTLELECTGFDTMQVQPGEIDTVQLSSFYISSKDNFSAQDVAKLYCKNGILFFEPNYMNETGLDEIRKQRVVIECQEIIKNINYKIDIMNKNPKVIEME